MKRLLAYTASATALTAMLFGVSACGGTQSPATNEKTAGGEQQPAGEQTQPAEEGLGMAKDVTVLAEDGSHVQLQSAWLNTNAVVIFLRGHW